MKKTKLLLGILVLLISLTLFVGCTNNTKKEPLVMGEPNWPGILAKNAVATHILSNIGYEVDRKQLTDPVIHQGLADAEVDIYLGSWMPSIKELRQELGENNIDLVTTNMNDGLYTMAVPEYLWEQGVRTYSDLNKYADKFDYKMYVGEAGWEASEIMNHAIDENIYNLGKWKAITSTQSALMAQMKKAINNEEWMVFIAWKPHWMNYVFDIKYLEDPEQLWESAESWVDTLARKGLKEDYPQVYKFLEQFIPDAELSNEWIYEIGYQEKDPDNVARKWVAENMDIVAEWLAGVKSANGKKAIDVLRKNINK